MADGNALRVARTKAFPAVGVRKHWQVDFRQICLPVFPKGLKTRLGGAFNHAP